MIRPNIMTMPCLLLAFSAFSADEKGKPGEVTLPIERYEDLLKKYWEDPEDPPEESPEAPVDVALSDLRVDLQVNGERANVTATLIVHVLSDDWVKVPLLPAGTALGLVTVNGAEDVLVEEDESLVLHLKGKGARNLLLRYQAGVDNLRGGHSL